VDSLSAAPIPTLEREVSGHRARLQPLCDWFLRPGVLIRVVLYLTGLIYLRTIPFDYVYDDGTLIVINPWMESWKQVPLFFTHSFWAFLEIPRIIDFYRPLVMVVLACIYHLLGPAPGWFHLVAASVHILATYLVYRLACETTGDQRLAAIAAGIFGLHPTKVETAAWISGLSDSLSMVFLLAAMIGYFKWKQQPKHKPTILLVSASFLLLALFSKEAAIFAPILIGIYEFSAPTTGLRNRCIAAMRSAWPYAAVVALAVAIRLLLVRNPTGQFVNKIPVLPTLLTAPKAILWYLGKQLWPGSLSVQYPYVAVHEASFTSFVLPLIFLLCLSTALVVAVRQSPIGIFFASWFALMLAPVIVYHFKLQVHDRYFYFASVATSIGLAYLIGRLMCFGTIVQGTTVLAVFVAMAAITWSYSIYWDNDIKLFTRVTQIEDNNPEGYLYLASVYINQGQTQKAEALAQTLIARPDLRTTGWYLLGVARLQQKDYEQARDAMQNALQNSQGKDLLSTIGLAGMDLKLGRNEEAAQIYQEALKKFPNMAYLHGNLAEAYKGMGKAREADRELVLKGRLQ
jgi:protein O-mannosyl-transferase